MARVKIKHVGVLAIATWHGLYSLIFSIFIGFIYAGFALLRASNVKGTTLLYYMVGIPILYGPLGFIAYAIVAFVYNSVAGSIGGVTLELDDNGYSSPPLPEI